jgi:hypothetical protein
MIENDLKKYSVSCMSNAKWRKFFSSIHEGALELDHCTWKLVNSEQPVQGYLPDSKMLGEDFVGDCGALNGPFEFRIIEWLLIPEKHGQRPYEKSPIIYSTQDIKSVEDKINLAGNFEYQVIPEGIILLDTHNIDWLSSSLYTLLHVKSSLAIEISGDRSREDSRFECNPVLPCGIAVCASCILMW